MATDENKDVNLEAGDQGVTIDALPEDDKSLEEGKLPDEKESTKSDDDSKSTKKDDDDKEDEVDFESELLETLTEKTEDKELSKEEELKTEGLNSLKTLKDIADKIDALPENQDANFNKLRVLNRELLRSKIDDIETVEKLKGYGDLGEVEKALAFRQGLKGYDVENGVPSAHEAAALVYKEEGPDVAYNLALNALKYSTKDGVPLAEKFTRNVLLLDPKRLADFQAISRGEIPEGYEGMVTSPVDLERIPTERHDAFKRLMPKQKEIVRDGFATVARSDERAEAARILEESQEILNNHKTKIQKAQAKDDLFVTQLETAATEIENDSIAAVTANVSNGLDKVIFSQNEFQNASMREGVETKIFDLVHASPAIRARAEKYFEKMGVTVDRQRINYWYNRLSTNIDVKASATVKGQTQSAEQAEQVRLEAIKQLSALALRMSVGVVRKVGGALASQPKAKAPEHQPPNLKTDNSSKGNGKKSFTAEDYAAATRAGKVLQQ